MVFVNRADALRLAADDVQGHVQRVGNGAKRLPFEIDGASDAGAGCWPG